MKYMAKFLHMSSQLKRNYVCMATVTNTFKLFYESRVDGIITLNCNVTSDNIRHELNGRTEAHIIEIVCSPAQEKNSR